MIIAYDMFGGISSFETQEDLQWFQTTYPDKKFEHIEEVQPPNPVNVALLALAEFLTQGEWSRTERRAMVRAVTKTILSMI